ncbi:sensor histidine kinase [Haloactinospora alba]|uniref:sensor histidine kinase n=1 Tax=Haloactinospora alba TaxID=405555 RepID=UPI0011504EE2|nr:nitrate- and nitrite sensing domain-containing protein [Haloactinospora alba]
MRSRLIALIVIPTAVAVVLGGMRIGENILNTIANDRVEKMASLGQSVVALSNELGKERMLSAAYIADDPDPEERSTERLERLREQVKASKQARQQVRSDIDELDGADSSAAEEQIQSMTSHLDEIESVRSDVEGTDTTVLPTVTSYRKTIESLTRFNQTIAESTENTELRESVQSMTALNEVREQLSYEAALMLHTLMRDSMSGGVEEALRQSRSRYDNAKQDFIDKATDQQRQSYDQSFSGPDANQVMNTWVRVMMRADNDEELTGSAGDVDASSYREAANSSLDKLQDVEGEITGVVEGKAASLKSEAINRALMDSLLVLAMIIAVFISTTAVVRSLVRPLRTLREGALRIAQEDLPDSITRMQGMSSAPGEVDVAPIDVGSRDEISEVAHSFDEVHRVALRLASDEAVLRSNVNAMFVNLSRRSQTLVERQLRLIDGLEQSEQDADRLSDLFQLDHLATRMRRNNENLLVLSGQDNTRKWAQPVPLVDVLRGAISEVEQYDRVNVRAPSHISVLGRPVNDVIHLIAELVENATSFSSHESQVGVSARTLDNGSVQVEVADDGIGMPADELEATNERLAEPPVIDVAVSRRMGLFVVSRLAARHGIEVQLQESHNGGITAVAVLPPDLLITPVELDAQQDGASSPPELDAGSAFPDTYAEATAAFAANPAPAESGDDRQPPSTGSVPSAPSDLPKRRPGAERAEEHPPGGEDLWRPANRDSRPAQPPEHADSAGQQPPAAEPGPEERPSPSPFDTDTHHEGPLAGPSEASSAEPPAAPQQPTESAVSESEEGSERPAGFASGPPLSGEQTDPSALGGWQHNEHSPREGYGSTAYLSRRYGSPGQDTVVPPSPEQDGETLPIFESIESNWFRRRTGGPSVAGPDTGPQPQVNRGRGSSASEPPRPEPTDSVDDGGAVSQPNASEGEEGQETSNETWRSASDQGWQAAQSVSDPVAGGLTTSGLPKRVPKANLVPGTAPQQEGADEGPARSAKRVRDRFAGFQKGLREGRNQTDDQSSEER